MVQSQEVFSRTIGGLAAAAGVGVETVRFYQRRGLLQKPSRNTGVRRYDADDLRRLRFIKKAQVAGFTLEEIKELLALESTQDRSRARELALRRLVELDAKVAQLQVARNALQRLAEECGKGSSGPCPILASFDGMAERQL